MYFRWCFVRVVHPLAKVFKQRKQKLAFTDRDRQTVTPRRRASAASQHCMLGVVVPHPSRPSRPSRPSAPLEFESPRRGRWAGCGGRSSVSPAPRSPLSRGSRLCRAPGWRRGCGLGPGVAAVEAAAPAGGAEAPACAKWYRPERAAVHGAGPGGRVAARGAGAGPASCSFFLRMCLAAAQHLASRSARPPRLLKALLA